MLLDVNFGELHCYSFIISMNRCDESFNIIDDSFGRICVPNKIEEVNLKLFNIIKWLGESKTLTKHISCAYMGI